MRYVSVEPLQDQYGYHLDPRTYLAVLPQLAGDLPAGSAAFAADPGHYDFHGPRCVKDLGWGSATLVDGQGVIALDLVLTPNEWKHETGLRLRYLNVRSFHVDVEESGGTLPRLGALQLDEILPHAAGVSHEIAFTCGSVLVVAADLVATWG
ncbi:hypothetical protein ABZ816_15605 [Actinosynnema sp. NPDC047251]|uniref:Uncharacterized protein n=1 Tax=Saccharothrix espanaensis (strain ATCC 51144 / DSM 44229 / JCM 9112 / NBRC 15066 / NRRL 15764) TaxID=1179773 RepID=K0JQF2_SACES|nr:hypothetical protein [Saccharothrix espanaensis]CCH29555.1 hypothetical protein BN6_22340 [Saccharothrix espanaensis DSM 44229]